MPLKINPNQAFKYRHLKKKSNGMSGSTNGARYPTTIHFKKSKTVTLTCNNLECDSVVMVYFPAGSSFSPYKTVCTECGTDNLHYQIG